MKRPTIILAVLLAALGSYFGTELAQKAYAARISSGAYVLPAGNPFTSGTTINSTVMNSTLSDIGSEVTNSLDRQGRGGMTGALRLSNGTSSAPALAFTSETNSGLYRAGTNDLRLQIAASNIEKWTATGSTLTGLSTVTAGVVATQSTTNGTGVVSTGNGTGNGVGGTGGATSGAGTYGTGGAPNGIGARGQGTGLGAGVYGQGGSSAGFGVSGKGGGTLGTGVYGEGGSSSGKGVVGLGTGGNQGGQFTGGASGGVGLEGTGGPGATGVVGTGGSGGLGGAFTGGVSDGTGLTGTGVGNGAGGKFYNSSTSAAASIEGHSISASAAGGYFNNTNGGPAIHIDEGHALFTGANPVASVGYTNTQTAKNLVKAWAYVTITGGVVTVEDGFNVSGCVVPAATTLIRCTFATAMADAKFAATCTASQRAGASAGEVCVMYTRTSSTVDYYVRDLNPVAVLDPATAGIGISFMVLGTQL